MLYRRCYIDVVIYLRKIDTVISSIEVSIKAFIMNLDNHIKTIMKDVSLSYSRCNKIPLNIKLDGTLDMRYKESRQLFREEFKKRILYENRLHNTEIKINDIDYRKEILDLNEEELMYFTKEKN